jgi:hypothetical protein
LHHEGFAVGVFEVQLRLWFAVPASEAGTPVIEHVLVLGAVPDMLFHQGFEQLGDMTGIVTIALQALEVAEACRLGFAMQRISLLAGRYRKLADLNEITDCSLVHVPDLLLSSCLLLST